MPSWSNPFARATPSAGSPDLPTADAKPTAPKGAYADTGADSEAPRFAGSEVTPSSYEAATPSAGTGSDKPPVSRSPLDYAPPSSTVSADRPYMAPQAGRYDTGGGYGSQASSPGYNDPPPYVASRDSAAGAASVQRGYSSANSYGRYGDPTASASGGNSTDRSAPQSRSPSRYGDRDYRSAPGYGDSSRSDPSASLQANPYVSRDAGSSYRGDSSAPAQWGSRNGSSSAAGVAQADDPRTAAGSGVPSTRNPAAASGYGDSPVSRPWNRDYGAGASAPEAARSGAASDPARYTPGNTGYQPGDTGYTPGKTGYNPPNTPDYQTPAPPYSSYSNPTAGDAASAGGYRPGSISRYQSSNSGASVPTTTASRDATSSYPAGSGSTAPPSYSIPSAKSAL